jgi:hypothetical protein
MGGWLKHASSRFGAVISTSANVPPTAKVKGLALGKSR